MDIPKEMNALVADEPGKGTENALTKLRVARIPVPKPARGQVLVRMHAAPCNPADLLYLEGRYGIDRPLPATLGFEGAGEVVASGGGLLGWWMTGKRVACGGHECSGTWAEYCLTEANRCLPLHKKLSFEQGATALANPITALALIAVMRDRGHRAYVQTGAGGQLGRMILSTADDVGIVGIHVVRRAAQADALRELGAKHVLVSTDADFDEKLAARCKELHATIAFDAVAGAMTGQLVAALPKESEVVVYGALSGDHCGGMDPMVLAFGHKKVSGFEIAAYLKDIGVLGSFRLANAAQKRVVTGRAVTQVQSRIAIADAPTGLAQYTRAMSEGKVLITF